MVLTIFVDGFSIGLFSFSQPTLIVQRNLDHLDILENITLDHYISYIILIMQDE